MARKAKSEVDWFDMPETPYRASRLMKTLGNPKAYALVRILLEDDVLSVDDISKKLNRAPWTASKILRPLRDLDVVRYQREGGSSLYTLKDRDRIAALLRVAEEFVEGARAQK
ncbi:MAG: winged helix-turn-helix domain-containing protein [Planctomycetes bacterium]|nr:winged helix-turn-helix domain-containing protein [Planctomycetota bacterium]